MISIKTVSNVTLSEIFKRSPVKHIENGEAMLRKCVVRSVDVRYGYVHAECVCVWGLIPPTLLSASAHLWLLTTDAVENHKFLFVRHSQRWIEQALRTYPTITGEWIPGNERSKRWLQWLGAEFGDFNGKCVPFMIRKKPNG